MLSGVTHPTVFDVGANVGAYTASVQAVNPSALVYAFEPHPRNIERLRHALDSGPGGEGNGCVSIIPYAVGKERGRLDLYDRAERDGSSHASLYQGVIENIHHTE